MKTLTLILIASTMLFQSCKKDDPIPEKPKKQEVAQWESTKIPKPNK